MKTGQAFGEQALMNDAPRGATITATSDCRCLRLSRAQFDEIVMDVLAPIAKIEIVLVQVPLLAKLDRWKLGRLAQATKERHFKKGEAIITEGETGDLMYLITSGSCLVAVEGIGETTRKGAGEYFGEAALLDNAPRPATVTATSEEGVVCLELSREVFEQHVPPSVQVELLLSQVRFQRKNPDFLLKNPDFLIKNPDFLLKNPDFLLKNPDFLLKNPDVLIKNPDFRLKNG